MLIYKCVRLTKLVLKLLLTHKGGKVMLWILVIVGFIGALYMTAFIIGGIGQSCYKHEIRNFVVILVICCVFIAVGIMGLDKISSMYYEEVSQTNCWELQALSDGSQIEGNVRSTKTKEVYLFYYKVSDDEFKLGKVDADRTTIKETEDFPHIVEYTTYTKNEINRTLRMILAFDFIEHTEKNYIIYIPKGSMIRTFILDLQ